MCGICGEVDFRRKNIRVEPIQRMVDILAHRGPDDEGMVFFRDGKPLEVRGADSLTPDEARFEVGLGHRRLSIIDLSTAAHQPMGNEDRTVWIVFNGEIYNFQELTRELEKKGHRFRSRSDTEAILHAYEEWGTDCLKLLRGMFAFGIWDSKRRQLFLARDRLGKKPLVYYEEDGFFVFASEIKALLQVPRIGRQIDEMALHHYLTYQYVPAPETIFKGIRKLPPAHYLICDHDGNLRSERYWKLNFTPMSGKDIDFPEICHRIREKIEESVKLRLISDVPLGAFLSGGVDSSLIVGIMSRLSSSPVKTFSIGFDEKDFDELAYARIVSEHFSTEHHEFVVKPDCIEILPRLVWHYNEPFADSSAIPTYYVAHMTKDYVKVVLTGDGGDENFAGYPRYLRSQWVEHFTKLPEKIRSDLLPKMLRRVANFHWKEKTWNRLADFSERLTSNQARNYSEQIKIFNDGGKKDLYSEEFANAGKGRDSIEYLIEKYKESGTDNLIDQLLYLDINTYLPEDLLVKVDLATMANSLEARIPFLDHEFMELVAGIPSNLKLKGLTTKYILKKSFPDLLPEKILRRRKMGFAVPVARWFRKELKEYTREMLLDRRTLDRGYFKREGIEHLLDDHVAERYDHSAKIWALLFLEIWFRTFIDPEGMMGNHVN